MALRGGSLRTVAKRRMGTERRSFVPSRVDMVLHELRRTETSETPKRSCGHEVMEFFQRGVRRERRDNECGGG
jgi:hypothetical protein